MNELTVTSCIFLYIVMQNITPSLSETFDLTYAIYSVIPSVVQ